MGKLSVSDSLEEPLSQATMAFGPQSELERLFELALAAELPRCRELKPWEPARMNERHLAMIRLRADGAKQRDIARAFECDEQRVSIILNHPDAEYLLSRIQAMRQLGPSDIDARFRALAEPAIEALEDLFNDPDLAPLRKAPHAFRVLEQNGYGAPKAKEIEVKHRLDSASAVQLGQLTKALRESQTIQDAHVVSEMPLLLPEGQE